MIKKVKIFKDDFVLRKKKNKSFFYHKNKNNFLKLKKNSS